VKLKRNYKLDAPKGVNGRNSDNTMILEPAQMGAVDYVCVTASKRRYHWIEEEMRSGTKSYL